MLPPFGDGVPHLVKAHVKLLDYVPVAVANVGGPGQEEVVGWFPHALRMEEKKGRILGEYRKKKRIRSLWTTMTVWNKVKEENA